jgi:hypothetical protein
MQHYLVEVQIHGDYHLIGKYFGRNLLQTSLSTKSKNGIPLSRRDFDAMSNDLTKVGFVGF